MSEALRLQLARGLSLAAHPLPVTGLLVLALGAPRLATPQAGGALLLAMVGAGTLLALLLHLQVRRGAWEHVDASRPQERPALFRFTLLLLGAALAAVLLLRPQDTWLARGLAGAGALVAVAWALLRWTKLSLHLAFAGYAAAVLLVLRPALALPLLLLLPALAWSRLKLGRHRLGETVGGAALGLVLGLAVAG